MKRDGLNGSTSVPNVGILTWHYYSNVGSNLQAWAMQHVLLNMGLNARFINYRRRELDGDRFPKGIIKGICNEVPFLPSFDTWQFQKDEFKQTNKVYSAADARMLCNQMDAVICGSDQIWAPNVFDPVYFLQGVSERVRKISYAASIGLPDIPDDMRPIYRELLSHYNSIGVREEQGRELIVDELGLEATTVLDPTFLVRANEWEEIAKKPSVVKGNYIFCYFLGDPERYLAVVRDAALRTGLTVVAYLPEARNNPFPECIVIRKMAVPEFLGWILGSSLVMTDSFHGIALSINLERQFCAYQRFDISDVVNQNSRVINILKKLDITDHLLPLGEYRWVKTSWAGVRERLNTERDISRSFLKASLRGMGSVH